ncbi:type IV secretion system protein [uncultured Roseobacter sp.]|uniref:type IV secretion system protein n=1 Tax=uncultured Roseobacter sp. TaxID=114847 RepID=UPI0026310412|nr:type IV secretion system protein [uncultured Roseobacter sp.]
MNLKPALLVCALALSSPAYAGGVPVIDTTAIANAKATFAKELAQMVKELEEAKRLYDAVNGLTEIADIVDALNDPKVRELLGPDAMSIASALEVNIDALGDLSDTASEFLDHTRVTAADVSAEDFYRQELDRIGARTARDAAVGDRIVRSADDRLAGLERLRQAIGTVSTQKEINALQARLQVESAMLQNDTNRIQGLAMLQEAQSEVESQRQREVEVENRERFNTDMGTLFGG